jgi:YggT family protein
MGALALVIWWALQIFFLAMVGRLIIDLLLSVNRSWRPSGLVLVLVESVMTVTDPPIKAVRKVIKPVRLGAIQLDLGWTVIVFAVFFLQRIVLSLA